MAGEVQVNQEAVARAALVKEGATVGTPTNAEVQKHEAAYRARLAKMPGGETTTNLSQVLDAQGRVTERNGETAVEANIGTQVDKNGKKTITEPGVKGRHDSAVEAEALGRKLSTEPYTSLTTEQQNKVRAQFDEVINATALSGLDKAGRDALFQDVIKDPEFLHLLRAEYGSATGKRIGERVTEAKKRLDEATARQKVAEKKKTRLEKEAEGLRAARDRYEAGGESTARMGELVTASSNLRTLETRKTNLSNQINALNARIATGKGDAGDVTAVEKLNTQLEGLDSQIDQAARDNAEYEALKLGKSGLPDRLSQKEAELEAAEEAYQLATGERGSAEADLTLSKSQRADAEREWIGQMENMPRTAMARYVEGKIGRANQAAAEALLELEKGATDARDKKMANYARTQFWRARKPTFWNKSTVEPNREAVMRNMDLITNPKVGPEDIVRHALRTQGLSQAEIDQQMGDAAFVNKWATEYSQQLFGNYIRLGGKVTPDMYEYISNQPWGENIVENAIDKNQNVKDIEAKLKASGALGPDGLAGYLKNKKKTLAAGVLAALLAGVFGGLPGLIATGVVAGAGSGAIDAGKHAYSQG